MSVRPRDPPEHALFAIKPGPLRRQVLDALRTRLARAGLSVVAQSRRRLQAREVRASFKYSGPEHLDLWTRDDCDALLVCGRHAPAQALRVKDELRRDFGRRRDELYNLLHLSDSGWEFVRQFELFFPDRELRRYAGFGDLLLQPAGASLGPLLADSSVGAVGLVGASARQMDEARAAGVDALWLLPRRIGGVGLLGLFADPQAEEPECSSAGAFFDWVRARRGLVFLDENDALLPAWPTPRDAADFERLSPRMIDACRRLVEPFRRLGLDGMVVVHPKRGAFQLEVLWELAESERLLEIGGSAGAARPLTFAIDRREVTQVLEALARAGI